VVAQERAARAVAAAVLTSGQVRGYALFVSVGLEYQSLGNFSKAIECHKERLTMAKEVGDRAAESKAYGNLGNGYHSHGGYAKAIEYHAQHLAIAKEVGDRAEEEYGASGTRIIRLGTTRRPSSISGST